MTAERDVQADIRIALGRGDVRLFRQQVGDAWIGESRRLRDGSVLILNPRRFVSGFEGWPDLGGWVSVVVTPEMVGQRIAIAVEIEVKRPRVKKARDAQQLFLDMAKSHGVRCGIARSVEEAKKILDGY